MVLATQALTLALEQIAPPAMITWIADALPGLLHAGVECPADAWAPGQAAGSAAGGGPAASRPKAGRAGPAPEQRKQ